MSIKGKIEEDFKKALKEKKKSELGVLRMLKSAIHNEEIEEKASLDDEKIIAVLRKEIKACKDSILDYQKAGRKESAEKEKGEIKVIEKYLPKMLAEDEIKKTVQIVIKETKAESEKDFGKVMGQVMAKLKGQAEGNLVSQLVKKELNK
ncbi:GatB/YqeY domain-containing protein [Patescibacteria group bacterium]|nr:MAG: GatB/YqeY domain-containing protein [Patescibacteria group bacterium]